MRRIVKGSEPEELRHWKEENAEVPQNLIYENMPKVAIKLQMLSEQGHLCAYTMQSIPTEDDCHIEHVVPQNQPNRPPYSDIDYNNLLACFPGARPPTGWNPKYPYGAQKKNGIHVNQNNFVSPLQEDVEHRFHYAADGSVEPAVGDNAADSSISILGLNHKQLVELRRAAIEERILDRDIPLSPEDAEALAVQILTFDSRGRLAEFCLAISQVAAWYAGKLRDGG